MRRPPQIPPGLKTRTSRVASILLLVLALLLPTAASAAKSTTRTRDKTAPTVSIGAPQGGAVVSGTLAVSGSASDNVQVAKVEVSVDGGAYVLAQGTTAWSASVDTTAYASGSHTISARATDSSGNTGVTNVSVSFSNADTTPPTVSVSTPAAGASVAGTVNVAGAAADNKALAKVELSVDGGTYRLATGTSAWSLALDSTTLANGSHTLTARATDTSGNTSTASVSVTVANLDSTPPSVAISAPTSGSSVSGSISVSGSAGDNSQLAQVAVSVDGGAYQPAQGTTAWSFALDTSTLANGSHTLTAQATDAAGNTAVSSETVTVQNTASLPPGVSEQLITPEGATIQISSDVTGWTAQQIYDLLKPNAYQLSLIGPHLTVKVENQTGSWTAASAGTSGGVYTTYSATIHLGAAVGTVFDDRPDDVVAHEYGHAWTLYHLYLTQQGDWTPYLTERGLLGDPRVDSTYIWTKAEMIADDYRLLFGDAAAQSEASYLNPYVADPRTIAGFHDWFVNTWGGGS